MADTKITGLTLGVPISSDVIAYVSDPGGTPLTKKALISNVGAIGGWYETTEAWSYATANTINVPTGATLRYKKGMGIRLKQGAGYKYFYIVDVANLLLTVTAGTYYTVANSAITDIAYSFVPHVAIGFYPWMASAAPVYNTATIDNGTGGVQPGTIETFFSVIGESIKLRTILAITNVVKNGAGSVIDFTIPLTLPAIADATFSILGSAAIGNLNYAAVASVKSTTDINIVSSSSIADNASIVATSVFCEWRY